jgi:hypothetical protein
MNDLTLPIRLTQSIIEQHVADETLLYDEQRHLAFCLNRTSAAVWALCDGNHSVAQMAAALTTRFAEPVTEEVVLVALAQLRRDGLLAKTQVVNEIPAAILSRRSMVGRIGMGSALLLPVVAAIAAPRAAQAYNGCVDCTPSSRPNSRRSNPGQ